MSTSDISARPPGARILVIEDNPTNMELMVYLLSAFGHTPLCAVDGEQGVAMARDAAPDLILCDVHLPKLDGYGVAAALRADPATAHLPVLAVTALAMVGDRERLLAAGFTGYVAKPIEPEQFVGQIETWLRPPATLLLVDDDPFMLDLLRDIFTDQGQDGSPGEDPPHVVSTAASARDGIAVLERQPIAVIVCDQCMPVATGTAFFERARQLAPHSYRIMLTACEPDADLARALAGGDVDRVMHKPFDGFALRAAVREGAVVAAARRAGATAV